MPNSPTAATSLQKKFRKDFGGGTDYYSGIRQVADNASPLSPNCDFRGTGSVGNRQGYTQIGTVTASRTQIFGMNEFHTASLNYLIKFASDGAGTQLGFSTGGAWSFDSSFTFTSGINVDTVEANSLLYSFNGVDAMQAWNGSSWSAVTNGKVLKYGAYYNSRVWGVDPAALDTLWFSGTGTADFSTTTYVFTVTSANATVGATYTNAGATFTVTSTISGSTTLSCTGTGTPNASGTLTKSGGTGDGTIAFSTFITTNAAGSIQIFPGSGAQIIGLKVFKDNLYVWLGGGMKGIFHISPATAANTFTVTMVTNTLGCVSHRSIVQIGNDIYFMADDGLYTLGEVAYYQSIRTTNKSLRMQPVLDAISGSSKQQLVGRYFNFKYHLFYPLYGGANDSCLVYDIRYQAMQDWRNIAAQDATTYTNVSKNQGLFFGHPSTGKVYQLYSGTTDDGVRIPSQWLSKSFDEGLSDTLKIYFDTTFVLNELNGSVTLTVIFNDTQVAVSTSLSQRNPQGGFGFAKFGRSRFGGNANAALVTQVVNQSERLHAKGKKFAIQYMISSTGTWSLLTLTQTFEVLPHYAFPSNQKLN